MDYRSAASLGSVQWDENAGVDEPLSRAESRLGFRRKRGAERGGERDQILNPTKTHKGILANPIYSLPTIIEGFSLPFYSN